MWRSSSRTRCRRHLPTNEGGERQQGVEMGNTSDGEFRGNLNSKFGMIDDALKRRYTEWNFGRDWQGPGPPPPRIDMKAYDDKYAHLVELWPLVEQFGDASVEGAQYEIDCLDRVIEKLARQAEDDHA